MRYNGYLYIWLIPLNELQDGTPYDSRTLSKGPEFMPLDNLLNNDILHFWRIHIVLSCYVFDGEAIDKEKKTIHFSYSTPTENALGMKQIRDSQMGGTPSSARIVEDVDRAL